MQIRRQVAVRARPFNQRELDLGCSLTLRFDGLATITLLGLAALEDESQRPDPERRGSDGRRRSHPTLRVTTSNQNVKDLPTKAAGSHTFTYDYAYNSMDPCSAEYASQETVYADIGEGVITNAYAGFNSTVFAYGQTGSGKSYSMLGLDDGRTDPGIIPRVCAKLFEQQSRVQIDTKKPQAFVPRETHVLCPR